MNHPLLTYRPVIAASERPSMVQEERSGAPYSNELQQAAELLEHAEKDQLERYVFRMVNCVASRAPINVRRALAKILGRWGRPFLQQPVATYQVTAGEVFGLELEGLSPEDQVFEVARHYARFVGGAAREIRYLSETKNPLGIARRAALEAAREFAPGLKLAAMHRVPRKGRWIQQGQYLIVLNP